MLTEAGADDRISLCSICGRCEAHLFEGIYIEAVAVAACQLNITGGSRFVSADDVDLRRFGNELCGILGTVYAQSAQDILGGNGLVILVGYDEVTHAGSLGDHTDLLAGLEQGVDCCCSILRSVGDDDIFVLRAAELAVKVFEVFERTLVGHSLIAGLDDLLVIRFFGYGDDVETTCVRML